MYFMGFFISTTSAFMLFIHFDLLRMSTYASLDQDSMNQILSLEELQKAKGNFEKSVIDMQKDILGVMASVSVAFFAAFCAVLAIVVAFKQNKDRYKNNYKTMDLFAVMFSLIASGLTALIGYIGARTGSNAMTMMQLAVGLLTFGACSMFIMMLNFCFDFGEHLSATDNSQKIEHNIDKY